MDIAENKIAVIIRKTDATACNLCVESLQELKLPDGFEAEIILINNSDSPAKLYNRAMRENIAKYKIYIDEHIAVLDENILCDVVELFEKEPDIGAIGVVGSLQLPTGGLAAQGKNSYGKVLDGKTGESIEILPLNKELLAKAEHETFVDVQAVDRYFIATQYDIDWREDLFDDETCLDSSQSIEFKRAGYRVVTLKREKASIAVMQDNNKVKEINVNKFLDEYSKDIYPLVSIVIPTYNRPQLFKEALDSVIVQDYRNLDIFITDNSHNELTKDLMKSYIKKYPNIKYEHHPDFDAMGNWVRAKEYNNPEAEYVNWLMDDDLFMPNKISVMVDAFMYYPDVNLVTSNRTAINIDGDIIKAGSMVKEDTKVPGKQAGKKIVLEMNNWIGEPTTALVRKSAMLNNSLGYKSNFDVYFISDYPTWLRVLSTGNLIYLKEQLSCFRVHSNQDTNSFGTKVALFFMMAKAIKYAQDDGYYLESWQEIYTAYTAVIQWAASMPRLFQGIHENAPEKDIVRRVMLAYVDALFNGGNLVLPAEILRKVK